MPWVKSDRDELLKEYANLKDFLPYLDELNRESPRGKVLISTGYLEPMLKDILCAFLMKDKVVDELFEGGNAPLGTFSARAKLAYTLGLISEPEFQDIDLIRRIRSEFARDMKASFENDAVKTDAANSNTRYRTIKGRWRPKASLRARPRGCSSIW